MCLPRGWARLACRRTGHGPGEREDEFEYEHVDSFKNDILSKTASSVLVDNSCPVDAIIHDQEGASDIYSSPSS